MKKLFSAGFVGVVAITLTATATASGPKWQEMGDAGSGPGGAQITIGNGTLGFINGGLGMSALFGGMVDFEDMFLINIVNPTIFRATTDPLDGELGNAFADFNTQLWLFQPMMGAPLDALGIVGNDDHPVTFSQFSLLLPDPTDGFKGGGVVTPGLYYIAITRFDNDPVSMSGEIFDQVLPTEISGPDGPGGMNPISGWTGDQGKFNGTYRIALQGVEFAEIPAPGALSLLALASFTMRRRRRR